jgi:hypothetical protein
MDMAIDIRRAILLVRGKRVMLDADLASIYGTPTKVLVQSVRRNLARFPDDFMFRLTKQEAMNLRSRFVTSSAGHRWGGRRHLPYAFTEQGVAMLSSVLRSPARSKRTSPSCAPSSTFVARARTKIWSER